VKGIWRMPLSCFILLLIVPPTFEHTPPLAPALSEREHTLHLDFLLILKQNIQKNATTMSKDDRLYGIPRQKKATGKEISSSSTLAFTSQLSSLIATSSNGPAKATARASAGRSRPKKEDIFSTHNKNSKKRAAKDLDETDFTQKHSTKSEDVDEDEISLPVAFF